jgi:hypothetical protein
VCKTPFGILFDELKVAAASRFNQHCVGLMFYRKFSNLPLELISPLHQSLGDDLHWAMENTVSKDISADQEFYKKMTHVALICPVSGTDGIVVNKTAVDVTGNSTLLFDYFEDEIYHQRASLSLLFKSTITKNSLTLAALVPVKSLKSCVKDIQDLLAKSK